jgi:thiol-disulfide isomerase/thioredoxin
MKKLVLLSALASVALAVSAADGPYNEQADANADVRHAIAAAKSDHKHVLLVFGANWCGDCRALDTAMHGTSQPLRIPCMPAGDSSRCRSSVPCHAGPGVSRTLILSLSS